MGPAEWLFFTLVRSTYFLYTFHNTRHVAPIQ